MGNSILQQEEAKENRRPEDPLGKDISSLVNTYVISATNCSFLD